MIHIFQPRFFTSTYTIIKKNHHNKSPKGRNFRGN